MAATKTIYPDTPCRLCDKPFRPRTHNHRVCMDCSEPNTKRNNVARLAARRILAGRLQKGAVLSCATCGAPFTYKSGPQKLCERCMMDKTQERALSWAKNNIARIKRMRRKAAEQYVFSGNKTTSRNRDGNACRKCGETGNLHTHHIDGRGKGIPKAERNDGLLNLITLCGTCHRRLHVITEKRLYFEHPETVRAAYVEFMG